MPTGQSAVERQVRMHVLPVLDHIYTLNRVEQRRLLLAWLVRMSGNKPAHRGVAPLTRKGYAAEYVTSMLWALKMVAERATYMHELAPLPVAGLCAIEPIGKPKRKASLVSLVDAARIAQTMHVIHQIALWLLRLAGLRISEAYGLRVSSVVIDEDGDGFLLIDAQGGRTFQRYTEERDGIVKVTMKPTTKTDAGYRLVAIPAALTELLQVVVRVFHTHDGMIDPDARLIPAIRSETGGAAGFRTALTAVAADVFGGGDDDKPAGLVPHDLRKAFGTDLAWNNSIADVVARRAMGQRAGTDVFSLVYTLDSRLKAHLVPVAKALEDDLNANEVVVMQPTTRRPSFSKDRDPAEHARISAALCAVGWHISADDDDGISTAEAAALLGMSEQATRRLYPDVIPAWQDAAKSWWARHDDVIDYRDRFKGLHSLHDLAAEAQRSYHQMYQLAQLLDTNPVRDERKRQCWYDDDDRDTLLGECRRVDALVERSMLVADAATALGIDHGGVDRLVNSGLLTFDVENDTAGRRYVTRTSVNAELARRRRPAHEQVPVVEFMQATGHDRNGINALVKHGKLVRAGRDGLTVDSVATWACGFRPDLLDSNLIRSRTRDDTGTDAVHERR